MKLLDPFQGKSADEFPILGSTATEGFRSVVRRDGVRIIFLGDLDCDADGANGQHRKRAAYRVDDKGSELLANGGMGVRNGKPVFTTSWGRDVALINPVTGGPVVLPDGSIPSRSSYLLPGKQDDPTRYLDAETIPYIVIPGFLVSVPGIVLGCRAIVTRPNHEPVHCLVGDVGPRSKVGEGSIELCRRLGVNDSPRDGGSDDPEFTYEFFPGQFAEVDGVKYPLLSQKGVYTYA